MFPHCGIVPEHFRAALVRTSNGTRNLLAAIPLRLDPEKVDKKQDYDLDEGIGLRSTLQMCVSTIISTSYS